MLSKKYSAMSDQQKNEYIQEHYIDKGMSFADIANNVGTYANKIRRDAKKFGIKIRDKSEAQSNALSSGKHKHPTKGKTRNPITKEKIGMSVMKSWDRLTEQELNVRKQKSKTAWDNLDDNQKANIVSMANQAVRQSSKTGSKLEKFLFKKLLEDGHSVEFHKEQILSNTKLQIDLFLPMLSIAIEVDGPSHFLPVWGQDALSKNQKYDKKKTGLIIGKGLALIRVKQLNDFSTTRASIIYRKLSAAIDLIKNNNQKLIEIEDSIT